MRYEQALAYIIGVAIGDGNLSNPNSRAVRLRITCDTKYPNIIKEIVFALKIVFSKNQVTVIDRPRYNCCDISVYSNTLNVLLPWKHDAGTKYQQPIKIPNWIMNDNTLRPYTLRGLIHTDGSIYKDRGYIMVNYTTIISTLAEDVMKIMNLQGYHPRLSKTMQKGGTTKYTVRLARNVQCFISDTGLYKN